MGPGSSRHLKRLKLHEPGHGRRGTITSRRP
jgi:hypothetical protein